MDDFWSDSFKLVGGWLLFVFLFLGAAASTPLPEPETIKGEPISQEQTLTDSSIQDVDSVTYMSDRFDNMAAIEITYKDSEGKEQQGYLLINKANEVLVEEFYDRNENIITGIILNEEKGWK